MSDTIIKKDPADTFGYFYRDILDQGIPDPNIKATVIYNDYLYTYYGTVPNLMGGSIPSGSKINLATNEIEEFLFSFNGAGSSAIYSGNDSVDMPANNKGILWNGDNLVTIVKTMAPFHGITLVKLDIGSSTLTLRALSDIDPAASIMDITIEDNYLYISGKASYDAVSYDTIWRIDLSTNSAAGCPTEKYTFTSGMRGGQSMHAYNNSIYFIGGRYYNESTQMVDDANTLYYSIDTLNLGNDDVLNSVTITSPVAMPPSIGSIPLVFDGAKVHIPYNPFMYTLSFEDGNLFKTNIPETISGNSVNKYSLGIVFLDFNTGVMFTISKPSSIHLVAHGTIQFYEASSGDSVEDNLYFQKGISKLSDKELIYKRVIL